MRFSKKMWWALSLLAGVSLAGGPMVLAADNASDQKPAATAKAEKKKVRGHKAEVKKKTKQAAASN